MGWLMLCPRPSFHPLPMSKTKLDVKSLYKRSSPASFWAFGSSTCTNERWGLFCSKFLEIKMTWAYFNPINKIIYIYIYKPIKGTHSARQTCFVFSNSRCCSLGVEEFNISVKHLLEYSLTCISNMRFQILHIMIVNHVYHVYKNI